MVKPGWGAEAGDALPLLWHWAYFPELAPADDLGPDGHPRRTDPWAGRFPRRLAGGGRVTGLAPLVLGAPAVRRSQLAGATERAGRHGGLVVCDWLHTYLQSGRTVRQETQTLIYAAARSSRAGQPPAQEVPVPGPPEGSEGPWELVRRLEFGPVLLFRFSAVTWNSHRIHYDRPYATQAEGYGGLLVHGPLLTMLLAQEAERVLGALGTIEFRALSPVLDIDTVDVFVRAVGTGACRAEARTADGRAAFTVLARAAVPEEAGPPGDNRARSCEGGGHASGT